MNQFQTEGSRLYYLTITRGELFRIQATNEAGNRIPPEIWKPYLYFLDKDSFFGLTAQTDGLDLVLTPADFVRLFQSEPHHYVTFAGQRAEDEGWLKLAGKVAESLSDPILWDHVSVEDGDIVISDKYGDQEIRTFLSYTIHHQLRQKGLSVAQLPYIQGFVQKAGWQGMAQLMLDRIAEECPDFRIAVLVADDNVSVFNRNMVP